MKNKKYGLRRILIMIGILAIIAIGSFCFIKEKNLQNQADYSYIEAPMLQNATNFSHSSRGYSWTANIPNSYKSKSNHEGPGPYIIFNIDENNPNCNFSITAPIVEKTKIASMGFDEAFEDYLEKNVEMMEILSGISNFEVTPSKKISIGKLSGTLFEYKKDNLQHLQFIAKYSEKELIGGFVLECITPSEEKITVYKNEFFGIINSFR
ncbi:MAG: hypothetical protein KAS02_02015 [Candidatus Pacebacteria bacterium]|nr:hypothetical protein [Candidatus Paceibacterota bacterium]